MIIQQDHSTTITSSWSSSSKSSLLNHNLPNGRLQLQGKKEEASSKDFRNTAHLCVNCVFCTTSVVYQIFFVCSNLSPFPCGVRISVEPWWALAFILRCPGHMPTSLPPSICIVKNSDLRDWIINYKDNLQTIKRLKTTVNSHCQMCVPLCYLNLCWNKLYTMCAPIDF